MSQDNTNIYKSARLKAGLTQETAAELLSLSVESVKAYETGQRVPADQTVAAMERCYSAPWLALEHGRATDTLGIVPQRTMPRYFSLIAVRLYNFMVDWAERHRGQQLLRIAEDGIITEDERPLLDEIICELEGISAAWLSLKCCEGAKKERPELAGSKRSVFQENPRTINKTIISQSPRNASKICAGEAVSAK